MGRPRKTEEEKAETKRKAYARRIEKQKQESEAALLELYKKSFLSEKLIPYFLDNKYASKIENIITAYNKDKVMTKDNWSALKEMTIALTEFNPNEGSSLTNTDLDAVKNRRFIEKPNTMRLVHENDRMKYITSQLESLKALNPETDGKLFDIRQEHCIKLIWKHLYYYMVETDKV